MTAHEKILYILLAMLVIKQEWFSLQARRNWQIIQDNFTIIAKHIGKKMVDKGETDGND